MKYFDIPRQVIEARRSINEFELFRDRTALERATEAIKNINWEIRFRERKAKAEANRKAKKALTT